MNLSCLQENLSQGLNIVSHISDKNTSLPILNNVLIKTENKNIKLVSTNLEIGISCIVRGKVDEDGDITIPARIFNDYVALLPNDKVDIIAKEGAEEIEINCNNFSTKIKGTAASDFPLIPSIEKSACYLCEVSINDFKNAIQQTMFTIAPNESRPEISGIFMSSCEKTLVLAATDSFRLAEKKIKIISEKNEKENAVSTIVPHKTLNEALRILSSIQKDDEFAKGEENLTICITENQILFSCKNIEIISRTIDAKYPDYRQIIPSEHKTISSISVKTLINSVKAASLFTKTGIYDISLIFDSENKKIKISSLNAQVGENKSEIDAKIEGDTEELILNYRFLLDGLNNINSENITIKVLDKIKPCILTSLSEKNEENKDYIYLIMPIKQ